MILKKMVLTPQERPTASNDQFPTTQLFLLGMPILTIHFSMQIFTLFLPSNMSCCGANRLDFDLPLLLGDGQGLPRGR